MRRWQEGAGWFFIELDIQSWATPPARGIRGPVNGTVGSLPISHDPAWIEHALQRSVLSSLSAELVQRVLEDAVRIDIPAGSVLYREDDPPRCGLLVSGLLRVFLVAADGRQVTMRYMSPGSLSGSSLVVLGTAARARVQAVTDVIGLLLNVAGLRALAESDARVAWAVATDVARSQEEIMRAFGASAFGSLRQRLARHLLDLAAARFEAGHTLIAPVTQQQLAEAVGSSREAVARVLRELRAARLVATGRGGVALIDPARLHAETEAL